MRSQDHGNMTINTSQLTTGLRTGTEKYTKYFMASSLKCLKILCRWGGEGRGISSKYHKKTFAQNYLP